MSFTDQIAKLTNPVPDFDDPEDVNTDTAAKVVDYYDEAVNTGETNEYHREVGSLRSRTAALLDEEDNRYAGKKITRKKLAEYNLQCESDDFDSSDEEAGKDVLQKFHKAMGLAPPAEMEEILERDESFEEDSDMSKGEEWEDIGSSSDEEQIGDTHPRIKAVKPDEKNKFEQKKTEMEEAQDIMSTFTKAHVSEDAKKGMAIKDQLKLFDCALESRIKAQKLMMSANKLPQYDVWSTFCERGGDNFKASVATNQTVIAQLLDRLVKLQDAIMVQNSDTEDILKKESATTEEKQNGKKVASEDEKIHSKDDGDEQIISDEEIPSDDDEELNGNGDGLTNGMNRAKEKQNKEMQAIAKKRKLQLEDYGEFLQKRHCAFKSFRNSTIYKWNERTKLTAIGGKRNMFRQFEQSALRQIEQLLFDEERLVTRTQLKRSHYPVLGKVKTVATTVHENETDEMDEILAKVALNDLTEYDTEIFDDNDFYHTILRELIERKASSISDPVALGSYWTQIQGLRNRMKKQNTMGGCKGPRLRYDVHPKLVNFMAPEDNTMVLEEARNELFSSLFGKKPS